MENRPQHRSDRFGYDARLTDQSHTEATGLPVTVATQGANEPGFWRRHLFLPACLFVPVAAVFAFSDLDRLISRAWAYDPGAGAFPARHAWWSEQFLHVYGRDLIWLVALGCVALLVASGFRPALRTWLRPLCFIVITIGITTGLIGGLKQLTRVHCPWELQGFGGTQTYVPIFAARAPETAPGACFPAAHSGSGFSLFALYFAFRDRQRRWAKAGLAVALGVGIAFSIGQEARGAHFVSHDLWSAFLAWLSCLSLYRLIQPGKVHPPASAS